MHKRFQRALTSLKENTHSSYAKIATAGGFCDLELILVKATSPEDLPIRERYIHELMKIFTISPPSFRTFASSFARRFTKTKCWRVALKCLILLHRLLRALPNNSPLRTELIWNRSHGYLSLNPCHFQDSSSSNSEDYTCFIRSYANLLDEALDCLTINCKESDEVEEEKGQEQEREESIPSSFPDKMKATGEILEMLPQMQSLLDRAIECRPGGVAAKSFLVHCAMKYIVRDSFFCYTVFRTGIAGVLEYLTQMPYRSCMTAFGVYKKAAVQADHLSEFYDWCKSIGLCGLYEYPTVERIPEIQIQALENFLNGMWQLTESSSSTGSPLASTMESPSTSTEDQGENNQLVRFNNLVQFEDDNVLVKRKKEEETKPLTEFNTEDKMKPLIEFDTEDKMKPLIEFDSEDKMKPLIEFNTESNDISWEVLLEASAMISPIVVSNNYFYFHPNSHGQINAFPHYPSKEAGNEMQIQVYNPAAVNPFHQPITTYPWGI